MRAHPSSFLSLMLIAAACGQVGNDIYSAASTALPTPSILSQRRYSVEQQLVLTNHGPGQPAKQNLWVALIRDFPPYQQVRSLTISPDNYTLVVDEYGNHIAEFDLSDHPVGGTRTITIRTEVLVNELGYDLSNCSGPLPDEYTRAELHVESANPQIIALANTLAADKATVCSKLRAFYDHVAGELTYTYNAEDWGAQAALGPMGSDCTEYASLLMALSRAQGIPARYFEGLRYVEAGSGADDQVRHAWPDVYMPGIGWVAADPTLGRAPVNRDTYFAHYTPDHIIVTMGRNPSTLRGSSYWSHLYWPGDSARITVEVANWKIELAP